MADLDCRPLLNTLLQRAANPFNFSQSSEIRRHKTAGFNDLSSDARVHVSRAHEVRFLLFILIQDMLSNSLILFSP